MSCGIGGFWYNISTEPPNQIAGTYALNNAVVTPMNNEDAILAASRITLNDTGIYKIKTGSDGTSEVLSNLLEL